MTEIRRVHYKLNGTESPVIHLACRTIEEAQEAKRLGTSQHHSDENWKERAINDLREWMKSSKDYRKTVDLWAAVYIKCGTCHRGFLAWFDECEIGPEDDLLVWLQAAQQIITEKRWI